MNTIPENWAELVAIRISKIQYTGHDEPLKLIESELAKEYRTVRADALNNAAELCEAVAKKESEKTIGIPTTGLYEIGARSCGSAILGLIEIEKDKQ